MQDGHVQQWRNLSLVKLAKKKKKKLKSRIIFYFINWDFLIVTVYIMFFFAIIPIQMLHIFTAYSVVC